VRTTFRSRTRPVQYKSYKTRARARFALGNRFGPRFAFPSRMPFIYLFFFISAGKVCNLHKGRVGDQKTMREQRVIQRARAYPLFLTRLPFSEYLFFRILWALNGVTVVCMRVNALTRRNGLYMISSVVRISKTRPNAICKPVW